MTNKIKLLLGSFLTILFVGLYTTYAYNLGDNAGGEKKDGIIKNVCFKNRKFGYNNYKDGKCPDGEFYIPHGPDPSNFLFYPPHPFPHLFFLNINDNGEGFIFRRSIRKNGGLSIKDFSFPSKSGFEYIDPKGKKSILTKVYYWHNTAYFFDPDTMHGFSFLGDRALGNLFLVANPFKDENNLYLINFHNKTAYSKTVDPKIALQYMLGDPQYIDKIKEVKWDTSYTLVPGGNEVLPPNFDNTNYGSNGRLGDQGEGQGWNYVEDLTLKSPNRYEGENQSNSSITGNTVAKNTTREEKKSCVAYYTYMRSMSSHSDGCLGEVNKDMSDTRLDYWGAISTDGDLSKFGVRDKTKYRRCWHWNNYKEGVKKTLGDKWPAFWKDRQTNYLGTEAKDIDVNALCSHIIVENSHTEKTEKEKNSFDVFLDRASDFRDYIELRTACFFGVVSDNLACNELNNPNSKNYFIKEKNNGLTGDTEAIFEVNEAFNKVWGSIYDPIYSGWVNNQFVVAQCGSHTNSEFNIFVYLILFTFMFYFIKVV